MNEGLHVTGRSRVIFLIGTPVAQTESPGLFNRHFAENGIDRVVAPLDLKPAHLTQFFAMVRDADNCDGIILTVPHKQAALPLVDHMSERARVLECVNVVRRTAEGRLEGDMTDGPGFWAGARTLEFQPAGKRVAIAGAGAAATAIAHEFALQGGAHLTIVNRDMKETGRLRQKLSGLGAHLDETIPQSLSGYDMAINATPLGMAYAPGTPFEKALLTTLPASAIVADAVTEPVETRLLADARSLGLKALPGAAMTRGQFEMLGRALGVM